MNDKSDTRVSDLEVDDNIAMEEPPEGPHEGPPEGPHEGPTD